MLWKGSGSILGREPSTLSLEPVDLSLQMIEAAGTDREITAIAREIVKLLSEDHYRWDDLLIVPNLQEFIKSCGPIFRPIWIGY